MRKNATIVMSVFFLSVFLSAQTPRLFKDLGETVKSGFRLDKWSMVTWKGKTYAVISDYENGIAVFTVSGSDYRFLFRLPNRAFPILKASETHLFVYSHTNLYSYSEKDQSLTPLIDPALKPGSISNAFIGGGKLYWHDHKNSVFRFWESDGTLPGTRILKDNLARKISQLSYHRGHLYYLEEGELKHFGSGGLTPQIGVDIQFFKWLDDTLIVKTKSDLRYWSETDGLVIDTKNQSLAHYLPSGFEFKGQLYFSALNMLYVTNGTPDGLRPLGDFGWLHKFYPGTNYLYAKDQESIWVFTSSGARKIAKNKKMTSVKVFGDQIFFTNHDKLLTYNPVSEKTELIADFGTLTQPDSWPKLVGATPDGLIISLENMFGNLFFYNGKKVLPMNRTDLKGGIYPDQIRAMDDEVIIFRGRGHQGPYFTLATYNTPIETTTFPLGDARFYKGRYIYVAYSDLNKIAIYSRLPDEDPILLHQYRGEYESEHTKFIETQWGLVRGSSHSQAIITDGTPNGTKVLNMRGSLDHYGSFGGYHAFRTGELSLYDGREIIPLKGDAKFSTPINLGDTLCWIDKANPQTPSIWIFDLESKSPKQLTSFNSKIFHVEPFNRQILFLSETGMYLLDRKGSVSIVVKDQFDSRDRIHAINSQNVLTIQQHKNGFRLLRTTIDTGETEQLALFDQIRTDFVFDGSLYFNASTDGEPINLWTSDGSIAGTQLLGVSSNMPQRAEHFSTLGSQLWFSWYTPQTGRELFSLCGRPDASIQIEDSQAMVPWAGPGATYRWSIQGGYIISGQGTRFISFQPKDGPNLRFTISITTPGECSATNELTIPIVRSKPN